MGGLVDSIFGGGNDAPPPPDYAAAAKETASGNLEAAKYATVANRANQYNPYGSLTWQRGATDYDPWTQTVNFTPEGQKQFDLQNQLQTKYAETANTGFDKARQVFENPSIDQSLLPAAPINAGTTAQQAIMSRLQPTLETNEEALRTRLANQGIGLGSTAYNREQALQGQRANDLYLQSAMQGIGLDTNARKDALNEAYTAQSRPLDLVNALRSGGQVQNPQFANYAQQQTTTGPNMSQAAQLGYEGQMGLFNAGQAQDERKEQMMMQAAGMFMSDRRTKENIVKIGVLDNGLNFYKFDYKPEFKEIAGHGSFVGVMADEAKVIPDAVIRQPNGYDMVDYSKIYA
jgi:hypothetical protein